MPVFWGIYKQTPETCNIFQYYVLTSTLSGINVCFMLIHCRLKVKSPQSSFNCALSSVNFLKTQFYPNSFISHHIFKTIINLWIIHHYKLEHLSHYQFICPKQNCKNIVCDQLNFIRLQNAVVLCYIMSLKRLILELQQTLIDSYKNNSFITVYEWVAYFYFVMTKIETKYKIVLIIRIEERNRLC